MDQNGEIFMETKLHRLLVGYAGIWKKQREYALEHTTE